MQIVIDIDDEDYKRIQDISDVFNSLTSRTYSAIRNGIPLPDGAEILTIDKRTLKAVTGRFVIYDREWLKEHFNTTEAHLYGGTRASDVPDTNAGDLISRQDAIDAADIIIKRDTSGSNAVVNAMIAWSEYIRTLPSVEPERKPGKWIEGKKTPGYIKWNCSECGLLVRNSQKPWYKYCPNCDAKMEVETDHS